MYPYIEVVGIQIYMVGLGIIVSLLSYIIVAKYLTKKYHQDFLRFFYWLPWMILLVYFFGSYSEFIFNIGLYPNNIDQLMILLIPKNYNFSFVGLLLGYLVSLIMFFWNIKRNETKKVWIDIFFLSTVLALVPWGIFAIFGDSFIGIVNESSLAIQALHPQSVLNKYNGVLPIGLFVSILSLIISMMFVILQKKIKQFGLGIWGFVFFLIGINIIFFFQQYPKYIPINIAGLTFDIKHFVSFFVIMFLMYVNNVWNTKN